MFCIDWDDDQPYEIVGYEFDDYYERLEVVLTPCNYIHTHLGYDKDFVGSECIGDLEQQEQYVRAS